jgi:hypothetical protein
MSGRNHTTTIQSSPILRGYGAVRPRRRPEDWRRVRVEVEAAIGEEAGGQASLQADTNLPNDMAVWAMRRQHETDRG